MQTVRQLSAPVGMTLPSQIAQNGRNFPDTWGELSQLLADISLVAKIMNQYINRAGLIPSEVRQVPAL